MGYFECVIAIVLIGTFFAGCLFGYFLANSRRRKAIKRKPASTAHLIGSLEQIISDWPGSDEELDTLIVLENMILYNS